MSKTVIGSAKLDHSSRCGTFSKENVFIFSNFCAKMHCGYSLEVPY